MSARFRQTPMPTFEATPDLLVASLRDLGLEEQMRRENDQVLASLTEARRTHFFEGRGVDTPRLIGDSEDISPEEAATIVSLDFDIEAAKHKGRRIQTPTTHRDEVMFVGGLTIQETLSAFNGQLARFTSLAPNAPGPIRTYRSDDVFKRNLMNIVGYIDNPQARASAAVAFDGAIIIRPKGLRHVMRGEDKAYVDVILPASLIQCVDIEFL